MRHKKASKSSIVLLIVGILLLVPGGVAFTLSVNQVWLGITSKNWPAAEGMVTRSLIDLSAARAGASGPITHTYKANIRYQYEVNGKLYSGDKIFVTDYISKELAFEKKQEIEYPVGSSVIVYYDPDNPELSVLEPGTGWPSFAGVVLGAIIVITGVFLLTTWWRKK